MGTSTGLLLGTLTGGLFAIGLTGNFEGHYSVPLKTLDLNPDKAMKVTIKQYDLGHSGKLTDGQVFYMVDKNKDGNISPEERKEAERLSDAYKSTGQAMIEFGNQIKTVADSKK